MRARGEQPDRDAAADAAAPSARPSRRAAAACSTSPTRSASSGLPPWRISSPGRHRFWRRSSSGSMPQRARDLVDLALADPLQVRRAERAVAARGRGIRVDAAGIDAERLPAVGPGRGVAARGGDTRPVVGVRAGVEPALDVAPEQAALARRGGAHARLHAVAPRGHHRLADARSGCAPGGAPCAPARRRSAPSSCTTSSRSRRPGTGR